MLSPSLASPLTCIWWGASWHRVLSTPNTFLGGTGDVDTRLGCGTGQAESQEQVHGQEQDSAGNATGTAQGRGTPATVLSIHTLAAPPCTPGLPLPPPPHSCSQASLAPSQPSSQGNYTLPKPIHHGLAIFYQHLSPDNLTPAVTA